MKERILKLVESSLIGAEDNLYRVSMMFKHKSFKELDQEYGQSGRTCLEILTEAQDEVAELKACATWVRNA